MHIYNVEKQAVSVFQAARDVCLKAEASPRRFDASVLPSPQCYDL